MTQRAKTFALALGGGGARGLAHIAVLEALDEMGIKPVAIAGVSIGAAIGAAYAAGMSGKAIRRHVIDFAHHQGGTYNRLMAARAAPLSHFLRDTFGNPMVLDAARFCAAFLPPDIPEDFSALAIPLTIVATDLHAREEVVFTSGPLRTAVSASMALPGLIRPVECDGRVLVDGAALNPVPFDRLRGVADVIVAVDPASGGIEAERIPDPWTTLFATLQVMGHAILRQKLNEGPPDLILQPPVGTFRLLDFFQASAILRAAAPIKNEIKDALGSLLERP